MTTYRGVEDLVGRAIPSLQAQTHQNWEAVVVGDADGATTAAAVDELNEPRVRFHDLPFRGPYPESTRELWHTAGCRPFNVASDMSRGAWLASLDQDDELRPDALATLLEHARRTRAEVVYGTAELVAVDGSDVDPVSVGSFPPRRGDFALTAALVHGCLREVRMSELSWLWDEPGDWSYAYRLWLGGAQFSFVDAAITTVHVTPKPVLGGLDEALDGMRIHLRNVEEARDFYRDQVTALTEARDYWHQQADNLARLVEGSAG
jgi:glycosyltransferase involved in cell wall biosynthesis